MHSVEYSIDGRTAVFYTLIFVANLMSCRDDSLFCRAPNAFVAAWILLSTSVHRGPAVTLCRVHRGRAEDTGLGNKRNVSFPGSSRNGL